MSLTKDLPCEVCLKYTLPSIHNSFVSDDSSLFLQCVNVYVQIFACGF